MEGDAFDQTGDFLGHEPAFWDCSIHVWSSFSHGQSALGDEKSHPVRHVNGNGLDVSDVCVPVDFGKRRGREQKNREVSRPYCLTQPRQKTVESLNCAMPQYEVS